MLNKLRLLTPGPTPLPERVRLALARDMVHHRKHDFQEIMKRIQKHLGQLFGTGTPVVPLSCSGTGAMTAAVTSLFSPGERVLVIEGGKFGERWAKIAKTSGLVPVVHTVPWGEAVNADDVANILDQDASIAGIFVQASETSTGVLHPIEALGRITATRKTLLVVDGISAVGISPCPMDAWGIDCLLTGSQKGLMLPPGLALLALSPRAWERAEHNTPGCFYFNLPAERDKLAKGETNFTTPVNLIVGLEESLAMLLESGLDAVYRKQWALTMLTRASVSALGLELFAPSSFTWGLTSVVLPEGVDATEILRFAEREYGVCMAGGQDHMKGRMIRIGHMGWVDWSDVLAGLYALAQGMHAVGGYSGARDYLEVGMSAYGAALAGKTGESVQDILVRS